MRLGRLRHAAGGPHRLRGRCLDVTVRGLGTLVGGDDKRGRQDDGAADRLEAERAEGLGAQRVVDLGDDARHAERVLRHLRRKRVPVVSLGEGHDEVGHLGTRPAQDVLRRAVTADGGARERLREAVEGALVEVDHGDVVALLVELGRRASADAAAADDDHPHGVLANSSVSTRRHQTGAVEFAHHVRDGPAGIPLAPEPHLVA